MRNLIVVLTKFCEQA